MGAPNRQTEVDPIHFVVIFMVSNLTDRKGAPLQGTVVNLPEGRGRPAPAGFCPGNPDTVKTGVKGGGKVDHWGGGKVDHQHGGSWLGRESWRQNQGM